MALALLSVEPLGLYRLVDVCEPADDYESAALTCGSESTFHFPADHVSAFRHCSLTELEEAALQREIAHKAQHDVYLEL